MPIKAKILASYCVDQNISRVNRFSDLKYVHLEATIKYIANIKLKRLIIENVLSPHIEIGNGKQVVGISSGY